MLSVVHEALSSRRHFIELEIVVHGLHLFSQRRVRIDHLSVLAHVRQHHLSLFRLN